MARENEQQLGYEELEAAAAEARQRELELEELKVRENEAEIEELRQDQEDQDIDYTNQLAMAQEMNSITKLAKDLYDRGMAFGSPSLIKWGIIFSLAIVNDVVDLLDLAGIGAILSWVISLGLTAIILLIIWFTDGGLKGAQEYATSVTGVAEQIQLSSRAQQIEKYTRKVAGKTASGLRRIPGLKNIHVRSSPRKNPLARAMIGSAIESIPFLGAVNLITIWVFFAYLAEKHAYDIARESAEKTYSQLSKTAVEMV